MSVPAAARPFIAFPSLLRRHGFAVSPDQTIGFLEAVGLLGPRTMADIRRAAIAMLAIPKEREPVFDALFRAFFLGQTVEAPTGTDDRDRDAEVREDRGGDMEVAEQEQPEPSGMVATAAERLASRRFPRRDEDRDLDRFARLAPAGLPHRRTRRLVPAARGTHFDLRRTLRRAIQRGGEALTMAVQRRRHRQRRVLLLIDVSGSMKERTEWALRFSHVLASVAERLEVFTLGTRLTRITPALAIRDRDRALARIGSLAADIDGGTRLGDALQAFLNVPRYSAHSRGAAVVVLSDGLERGDPGPMVDAVRRLSRDAWRLTWLTPLAADAEFSPQTRALSHAMHHFDELADGSTPGAVADHLLAIGRLR